MYRNKLFELNEEYVALGKAITTRKKVARELVKFLLKTMYVSAYKYGEKEKLATKVRQVIELLNNSITHKIVMQHSFRPKLSIIVDCQDVEGTIFCLKSLLLEMNDGLTYEVVVRTTDNSVARQLDQHVKNVQYIQMSCEENTLAAFDRLISSCTGEYILCLRGDSFVMKGWRWHLYELLENNNDIGCVASKVIDINGKLKSAGKTIWADGQIDDCGHQDDADKPEYNYVRNVDSCMLNGIAIRKSLWNKLGGFRVERFDCETYAVADWALRIQEMGYVIQYQPLAVLIETANKKIQKRTTDKQKFVELWNNILNTKRFNKKDDLLARRSLKKTILVIDDNIPKYDTSAGARNIYQYIQIMLKMGFDIKFISADFKFDEQYTNKLQQLGVEVLWGKYCKQNWQIWLRENSSYIDFAFITRPQVAEIFLDEVKKATNAKVIYSVADLHFLRMRRAAAINGDDQMFKAAVKMEELEFAIMDKADVVLTLSYEEKSIIQDKLPNKETVVAPIFFYDNFDCGARNIGKTKGLLFVGGFSHSPNVDAALWFVREVWPILQTKLLDCKLYLVGSNPIKAIQELANDDVLVTGYVKDDELQELYQNTKVCIIPLRYGAGIKGKLIEAMYNRIPIVSTSIGAEGLNNIKEYVCCKDEAMEFANAVLEFYLDDEKISDTISRYHEYLILEHSEESIMRIFRDMLR